MIFFTCTPFLEDSLTVNASKSSCRTEATPSFLLAGDLSPFESLGGYESLVSLATFVFITSRRWTDIPQTATYSFWNSDVPSGRACEPTSVSCDIESVAVWQSSPWSIPFRHSGSPRLMFSVRTSSSYGTQTSRLLQSNTHLLGSWLGSTPTRRRYHDCCTPRFPDERAVRGHGRVPRLGRPP